MSFAAALTLLTNSRSYSAVLRPAPPPPPQVELAPRFFKAADPHRLSRRKRYERIEPLYDKYNDPNAWRLSKRRG